MKDRSKLTKKIIVDKTGKRTTVWVKSNKDEPKSKIKLEDSKYNYFGHSNPYPSKIFKDKDGNKHLIYIDNNQHLLPDMALIKAKPMDNLRFNDRTDRYGNKGYYTGTGVDDTSGYLFLSRVKDKDYYTADAGKSNALWTLYKYRRKGIATALHEYATKHLKAKIKTAKTLSEDSRAYYGVKEGEH